MRFANVEVVAEYRIMSQTINLNDLVKRDKDNLLKGLSNNEYSLENLKTGKLIAHEGCHFIDHIATLSGMYMLQKVYNAINELEAFNNSPQEKVELVNIKSLLDYFNEWKQDKHTQVFKQVDSKFLKADYWKFNFKGAEINYIFDKKKKPILKLQFKMNNEVCAEVPFTIESLWETNAMFVELDYHLLTLLGIKDEGTNLVETSLYNNLYKKYLYTPELFTYSVAAHLTSSFANLGVADDAFKLSKILSDISLNLPFECYKSIKKTRGTLFNGLVNEFLEEIDELHPPVVFMALLENIMESEDFKVEKVLWNELGIDINSILKINNLPDKESLRIMIMKEMESIELATVRSEINQSHLFEFFKKTGIDIFSNIGFKGYYRSSSVLFINYACKVDNIVFQGMDEEAFYEEETQTYIRQEYFDESFRLMQQYSDLVD